MNPIMVKDESKINLLAIAEALAHDVKRGIGIIGLKFSLTQSEILRLNNQNKNINTKYIEKHIIAWKKRMEECYSNAEKLAVLVRTGKIGSESELTKSIESQLFNPICETQVEIDSDTRNFSEKNKKHELIKLKDARLSVSRLNKILEGLILDLKEDNWISYKQTNLRSHVGYAMEELVGLIHDTESKIVLSNSSSIKADQPSILALLINLIENSIKYRKLGEPAEIDITFNNERLSDLKLNFNELFKKYEQPEEWASITISDNGIGIPENERTSVFEMGYRGESAANIQGSGYGLSQVKSTVRRHRGKYILLENEKGGVKIILFFPQDPLRVTFYSD